ncbi:bifunctional alpha,alpha-trehalose-phosphate synthase (UDP-forming)/trehalose-phosphatase [uncultured Agrococcus sp.]|uniref:bifunctional alpha,alpha-trehalose-phosphate synthase (UDP-forming)/trehalose-phosphatase n=1 Tax=uncultured Agrococcus sp. TaxID=382258 RepID=UPI0025E4306B|nr:bifunctional alpha,alpha-trehalose-phosphate synthase (UDP-forming)/trehalose-phosphatase [uncultured Agrococcus sp.]
MTSTNPAEPQRQLVVVSNRLPVDRVTDPDGTVRWQTSPGGLVTAMEPVVRDLGCLWVGWPGNVDEQIEPFEHETLRLHPITLSTEEHEGYYEGLSNSTFWPLYHDLIATPDYHRPWWDHYLTVNQRFADVVAEQAPEGAIVWVHDYQLQLVPGMLREVRPDLTIAFFLHIPFPARRLFGQLPWRRQIIEGLLGADVIGFQRVQDALSFRWAAEHYADAHANGNLIVVPETADEPARAVLAQEFPISIDTESLESLAADPAVRARAKEIREELGNPRKLLLGVDRLDYTKGIRHRLKAFAELLGEGDVKAGEAVMVQVASPSRERVEAYKRLKSEVEGTVGQINGQHGTIGWSPVVYLHRGFPRSEMVALYLAADVVVVTALRDGMNLVAKEYVACRDDEHGVLVLSEFAGAADEMTDALLVNPHDIDGLKSSFLRAMHMPAAEQQRRMSALRHQVKEYDVAHWANSFLRAVNHAADERERLGRGSDEDGGSRIPAPVFIPTSLDSALRRFASEPNIIVACDFDGTLAPIARRPKDARILPRAEEALSALQGADGVHIALISGRSLDSLRATGVRTDGRVLSGSHGVELTGVPASSNPGNDPLSDEESSMLRRLLRRLRRVFGDEPGVRIEEKAFGVAVHTREVRNDQRSDELLAAAVELGSDEGFDARNGKRVREFTVRHSDKGRALQAIREQLAAPILFFGDDVTDEDAFEALGPDDIGVRVGDGETAAAERVPSPEAVAAALARLAELRTGVVIGAS